LTDTLIEKVRTIASDVFSVPLPQISIDSSPETIDSWDSIQHLTLALTLEEKFGIQLSPEEIERMRNIGETAKMIQTKLQSMPT
jgi:acyl carrier protein